MNEHSNNAEDRLRSKFIFTHMKNVKVVEFDERYIVTGSEDKLVEVR